jgi:hypothetical protein
MDLATILVDSVVLLQTPAVAEPTEVGIELSAEAWQVITGIPAASRSQAARERHGRHARDPRNSVEAGDVMGDAFEVVCCHGGDHRYWGYSEISLSLQRIRGPYETMAAALVAYDQRFGLTTSRRRS